MTPEGMLPFYFAFIICASGVIFFSLFAIAAFLGLAAIDIWDIQEYPKQIKALLLVGLVLFPEIGVMSWSVYFSRSRKPIFRIIAFVTSGIYLLLQIGMFYLPAKEKGLGAGLTASMLLHFLWLPLILIGGVISFAILRIVFSSKDASTTISMPQ
jgi:hypothetical protein